MKFSDFIRALTNYIWIIIELGGAIVILAILASLLLGDSAGPFLNIVKQNSIDFVGQLGGANLLGVALVFFIYIYLKQRKNL